MTNDDAKRFSDEELHEFYENFKKHEKKELETDRKLLDCQRDLNLSVNDLAYRTQELEDLIKKNSENLEELTKSTEGLIILWRDTQGAIHVASSLGKAFRWLSGLAVIGWIFVELAKHVDKVK